MPAGALLNSTVLCKGKCTHKQAVQTLSAHASVLSTLTGIRCPLYPEQPAFQSLIIYPVNLSLVLAPEHSPICIPFSVKHTFLKVFASFWNDNWLEQKIKIYLQIFSRLKNSTQGPTHVQQWGFVACYWPGVAGEAWDSYRIFGSSEMFSVLAYGISNEKFMPKYIPSDFLSLHSFRGHV